MKAERLSQIKIIPKDLNIELPTDALRMIMVQPFLKLQKTDAGFKIDNSILKTHKKMIKSILKLVSNLPFGNMAHYSNFILFPELSLPNDMIFEMKDIILDSWKCNSILVGGIEGMSISDFDKIVQKSDNPDEAKYKLKGTANYVNCAVTYVKESQPNTVKLYLQPKIKPSRWEQAIGMREGRHTFFFFSSNFNFLCLTCFDAISTEIEFESLVSEIIRNLKSMSINRKIPNVLDMVFILMHNNDPHSTDFQKSAYQILEGGGREFRCDHGSIAFVNTANAKHGYSNGFGKSAFYFRRGAWYIPPKKEYPPPDTYCMEKTECGCQRARFREDGPSMHRFYYIPYTSVPHTQGGKWYPLRDIAWYKINSNGTLSRAQQVPGIKKVIMDNLLPNLPITDNRWDAPNSNTIRELMIQKYNTIREIFINTKTERMKEITDLVLLCYYPKDNRTENPDDWQSINEGEAIKEIASTLSILCLIEEIILDLCSKVLTAFLKGKYYIVVIDGKGIETQGAIQKAYEDYVKTNAGLNIGESIDPQKNILLILCRHRGEQPCNGIAQEMIGFTLISKSEDSTMPQELQDTNRYTGLSGGRVFWHSRESLQGILDQKNLKEAKNKLKEKLVPLTN